jgi:hemerythrin
MALITWDERYSVGVRTLDKQHNVLFGILNDLYDAVKKGHAQTVTSPLLNSLTDHTRQHFASEENLMASTGFPGAAAHREKHQDLMNKVEAFSGRLDRGDVLLSVDLFNSLSEWIATHIQKEDKEYGPWLNERGVD